MDTNVNFTMPAAFSEICEDLGNSVVRNGTGFNWTAACLQLVMVLSVQKNYSNSLTIAVLENMRYVKIISDERDNVETHEDYRKVSKKYGLPVALCISVFKGKLMRENCSFTLVENNVTLGNLDAFCKEHKELHVSKVCKDVLLLNRLRFNITQYFPSDYELIFYSYVFPAFSVFVVIVNIVMILTFLSGGFSSSAHIMLICIATMDTLTVALPTPYIFYYLSLKKYIDVIPHYDECIAIMVILSYLVPLCHGIAVWLTFGIAVQRYTLLLRPESIFMALIRRRYSVAFIAVVTIIVCIVFVPGFISLKYFPVVYVYSTSDEEVMTTLKFPILDASSMSLENLVYFGRVLVIQTIPCIGMCVLGIELISDWRKVSQRNMEMVSQEKGCKNNIKSKSVNVVLMYVFSCFLLAEIPVTVCAIIVSWSMLLNDASVADKFRVLILISNLIIILTSPANFIIYYIQSHRFRNCLKTLLSCRIFASKGRHSETVETVE